MNNVIAFMIFCFFCISCTSKISPQESRIQGYYVVGNRIKADSALIVGYVKDRKTGAPLLSASVSVEGTKIGVFTDSMGFFSLSIPSGKLRLSVANVGNATLNTRTIKISEGDQLNILFYLGTYEIR